MEQELTQPIRLDPPFEPEALRSLFPSDVVVEIARPALVVRGLYPEEQIYIARAVDKRKAEFATARVCARYALIRLGVKPCALVPQADRSPTWPPGVKGTISHTTGCCAVAVTTATDVLGIGLDVDQAEALDLELEKVVCTRSEQAWLDSLPASDRGLLAKLLFCAKEAFYKCQYGVTGELLDFQDVEIEIDREAQTFRVRDLTPKVPQQHLVRAISGKFRKVDAYLVVTALLRSGRSRGSGTFGA